MGEGPGSVERCRNCGTSIDIRSAVKMIVEHDGEQSWTVLCGDCAVVECRRCGADVPIEDVLGNREGVWSTSPILECERCEEDVTIREAVELRNDQGYRRRVCEDCLKDITVPPGYRVVRDIAPDSV